MSAFALALGISRTRTPAGWFGWLTDGSIAVVALALVSAIAQITLPITLQRMIDGRLLAAGGRHDPRLLTQLGIAAAMLAVAVACTYVLNSHVVHRSEAQLDALRRHCYERLCGDLPVPGRVTAVERTIADLEQVSQYVRWNGPALVTSAATLVVALIAMVCHSVTLAGLTVLTFLLLIPVERGCRRSTAGAHTVMRQLSVRFRRSTGDMLAGSALAAPYAEQRQVADRALALSHRRDRQELRLVRGQATGRATGDTVAGIAVAVVVGIGAQLTDRNEVTLGGLVSFLILTALAASAGRSVVHRLGENREARVALRRAMRTTAR
jgi:ABC-type multidrug transport system fused ATPase/permease subunit